jgi:uncharacterized membrane protein YozB (DUF420 family)
MIKYFLISKKIHRFLVVIVTSLILIMAFTGLFLKYPYVSSVFYFLDLGMIRYVHNQLSPWLTVFLLLMMITGVIMYLALWPKKNK